MNRETYKKNKKRKRAPYIYHRRGMWNVYIKISGELIWVGSFTKWINAVIRYNEVMSARGGLLSHQRDLKKKKRLNVLESARENLAEYQEFMKGQDDV